MQNPRFLISLILVFTTFFTQVGTVFALPAFDDPSLITGTVQSLTIETDPSTVSTTVLVTVLKNGQSKTVRISLATATSLGLVALDGDGNPLINESALGQFVKIDPATVIAEEQEFRHPVGNALATFFANIPGIDYDTIMAMQQKGFGFGVIAQALWLTGKMEGDSEVFQALVEAKNTGDFSAFVLEDGTTPQNWGQLKKAIQSRGSLGVAMSGKGHQGNGQVNNRGNANGHDKEKDKDKDQGNNGNGNGNNK